MDFDTVLIANRGEIALRIIRTLRRLGLRSVAVYSEVDREAPHVAAADAAVCIGPASPAQSYLNIEKLLAAAWFTGAKAIHPGYGFLSENPALVRACAQAGLVFIGPGPEAMEALGNKRAGKLLAERVGVPFLPGYQGEGQDDATLGAAAARIGYPVMVKAAAGGGGRGMRLVEKAEDLPAALRSARAEAQSAFGNGELLLERAVVSPRHVEMQVFADALGGAVYLGERDCSVQRRHQKVIEEAPSPAVDQDLRERMGEAALKLVRAAGYVNAGTVEFLLDDSGRFYFMEMNARLQVEHPVTELVTGLDLVEWQLRVAAGEPLPRSQDEIVPTGHAVEARLYAEDPARGYLPQTGRILRWRPPEGLRVEAGIREGLSVSPHYDPLLAKLIAHGRDRREACRKLADGLERLELLGLRHNRAFLAAVLRDGEFLAGRATTDFLARSFAAHPSLQATPPGEELLARAALILGLESARRFEREGLAGWRSGSRIASAVVLGFDDDERRVIEMERVGRGWKLGQQGWSLSFDEADLVDGALVLTREGRRERLPYARDIDGRELHLDTETGVRLFRDASDDPPRPEGGAGSGLLKAPMDGAVSEIFFAQGARVNRGEKVLVLEAMKMEHAIAADVDGFLKALHVSVGDQVKTSQILATVVAGEAAEGG